MSPELLPRPEAVFEDIFRILTAGMPFLAVFLPAALAVWAGVALRRVRLVRGALADRATVEVVPTATFDPSESEVGRWARQLGRVHYAADGVPARGSAARLRYSAVDGKMRCYLEGPATAAAVLTMPGFAEVEVRAPRAQKGLRPVRFAPREAGQ